MNNAKEYLQKGYRLNEMIKSNEETFKQLEAMSTSISSCDMSQERVQSSPASFDKIGNVVAKIVDLQTEIKSEINEYVDFQKDIREKIAKMQNKNERLVLMLRYINFHTWEMIAVELDFTFQWVHVLHKRALKNFEVILNS